MLDSPPRVPKPVAPDSPGARSLIALSDEYLGALYPPEFNFLESVEALQQPNVCFLGIQDNGELVACGAIKLMADETAYGELKRVFVLPAHRCRGHARNIMQALESVLRATWSLPFPPRDRPSATRALGHYETLGYHRAVRFGGYPAILTACSWKRRSTCPSAFTVAVSEGSTHQIRGRR